MALWGRKKKWDIWKFEMYLKIKLHGIYLINIFKKKKIPFSFSLQKEISLKSNKIRVINKVNNFRIECRGKN